MFTDSAVKRVTPFRFLEQSTRPPRVFPVYLGDGMNTVSIDASGLQGMNHGVPNFASDPTMGDMYIVRAGMSGDQVSPMNHAPLGWLDWTLDFEGGTVHSGNFEDAASNWKRELFIDEARVETEFIILDRISMKITVWTPFGQNKIVIECSARAYDHSNQPVTRSFPVKLRIQWNFTNRRTRQLLHIIKDHKSYLSVLTPGHEQYEWCISAGGDALYDGESLTKPLELTAGNAWETKVAVFSLERDPVNDLIALRDENAGAWREYYAKMASIAGISNEETFLYNNALYLLHACFNPRLGFTIGFPFSFPTYWHSSVFWDSAFIADGLMRAGDRNAADQFLDFLYHSMRPGLKPYVWMCLYDGTPTIDESRDMAPLVLAAHATTAIRYYEYYQDRLEERVLPILKRVCDYAVATLFAEEDGKWILAQKVSHDVCEQEAFELNHTYTHVWFLSVFDKYVEYAKILHHPVNPVMIEILHKHKIEINHGEYYHCRGVQVNDAKDASWVPFLLYPTDAGPFVDLEVFRSTRKKSCFNQLYMEKQGSFQPWASMMQMLSDLRLGENELAWQDYDAALEYVYGPGYFSEIGPHQQTGGLPPYATAVGIYLSASLYPFIRSSVRGCEIGLFDGLRKSRRSGEYHVDRVAVMQGAAISAVYAKGYIRAVVHGRIVGATVISAIPDTLKPSDVRVLIDGKRQSHVFDSLNQSIRFTLPDAAREILIG